MGFIVGSSALLPNIVCLYVILYKKNDNFAFDLKEQ